MDFEIWPVYEFRSALLELKSLQPSFVHTQIKWAGMDARETGREQLDVSRGGGP
jgi:hypothetical protein